MEMEMEDPCGPVDMNHKQVCLDLEKATQCITQAFRHEVVKNQELCMMICRLEEKEAETGRSLTEQVESNKQLKLKIDELQKHLEEKNNSLTQANQTVSLLKNELRDLLQQLKDQRSNRAVRMVLERLHGWESHLNGRHTQQIKSRSSPLQSEQLMAADEPDQLMSEQMMSSDGQIPLILGIKEENSVHGYEECSQYGLFMEKMPVVTPGPAKRSRIEMCHGSRPVSKDSPGPQDHCKDPYVAQDPKLDPPGVQGPKAFRCVPSLLKVCSGHRTHRYPVSVEEVKRRTAPPETMSVSTLTSLLRMNKNEKRRLREELGKVGVVPGPATQVTSLCTRLTEGEAKDLCQSVVVLATKGINFDAVTMPMAADPSVAIGKTTELKYQLQNLAQEVQRNGEVFHHLSHGLGPGMVEVVVDILAKCIDANIEKRLS